MVSSGGKRMPQVLCVDLYKYRSNTEDVPEPNVYVMVLIILFAFFSLCIFLGSLFN